MTTPQDERPTEERIVECISQGRIYDPTPEINDRDPAQLAGQEACQIDASWLRNELLTLVRTAPEPAIRLRNVWLTGEFDLQGLKLGHVQLESCLIDDGLLLSHARLDSLDLTNTRLGHLTSQTGQIGGDCIVSGPGRSVDLISLLGCQISGRLTIAGQVRDGLDLSGSEIRGDVAINCGLDGAVRLYRTTIGGSFEVSATLTRADLLVDLSGLKINGDARLVGMNVDAAINLTDMSVGGTLIFSGGHYQCDRTTAAIMLEGSHIGGDLLFGNGFTVEGEVSLTGAVVDGQLVVKNSRLINPGGDALTADGITVGQDIDFRGNARVQGTVRFPGSVVGGQVKFLEASFTEGYQGTAVIFTGASIRQEFCLDSAGLVVQGELDLRAMNIGSDLRCLHGQFRRPGGRCIRLSSTQIHGDARISVNIEGRLSLRGTRIDGGLNLGPGKVVGNRASAGSDVIAVNAGSMRVSGDVLIAGLDAIGRVSLFAAELQGDVRVIDCSLRNEGGIAFDLEGGDVGGILRWAPGEQRVFGHVDLAGATVSQLSDEITQWPSIDHGGIDVRNFSYRNFTLPASDDSSDRADWLSRQIPFAAQPYEQLARVFRDAGSIYKANRALIFREKARYQNSRKGRRGALRRRIYWQIHRAYGTIAGYGFRPWRLAIPTLVIFLLGVFLFGEAKAAGEFIPTRSTESSLVVPGKPVACTSNYPCLSAPAFALDALLPVKALGQRDYWVPNGSRGWGRVAFVFSYLASIAGWLLTTILLAALIRLMRA